MAPLLQFVVARLSRRGTKVRTDPGAAEAPALRRWVPCAGRSRGHEPNRLHRSPCRPVVPVVPVVLEPAGPEGADGTREPRRPRPLRGGCRARDGPESTSRARHRSRSPEAPPVAVAVAVAVAVVVVVVVLVLPEPAGPERADETRETSIEVRAVPLLVLIDPDIV